MWACSIRILLNCYHQWQTELTESMKSLNAIFSRIDWILWVNLIIYRYIECPLQISFFSLRMGILRCPERKCYRSLWTFSWILVEYTNMLHLFYFREEIFLMLLPPQISIQRGMPVGCCTIWLVPSNTFIPWTLFTGISNLKICW